MATGRGPPEGIARSGVAHDQQHKGVAGHLKVPVNAASHRGVRDPDVPEPLTPQIWGVRVLKDLVDVPQNVVVPLPEVGRYVAAVRDRPPIISDGPPGVYT